MARLQRSRLPTVGQDLSASVLRLALRDAVRSADGARTLARGLYDLLHGTGRGQDRFERWCETVASLPRRQTRVLTWPVVTVFPFLAQPDRHIFVKPNVSRVAAAQYGFDLCYLSRPNWRTYASLLKLADVVRADLRDLRPRDLIDVQSFLGCRAPTNIEDVASKRRKPPRCVAPRNAGYIWRALSVGYESAWCLG